MPAATARWIDRDVDLLAVHEGLAGDVAAIGPAEDAHRQFGAAGAHQAGDADDLAAIDVQADALDDLAPGVSGCSTRQFLISSNVSPILGDSRCG